MSSLPKTVLWKRFNKQLTAGGRDWEERGAPQGHQDVRAALIYCIHTRDSQHFIGVLKSLHCKCINKYYIHIVICINIYTYTDNKGLTLWQEKEKTAEQGKAAKNHIY